MQGNWTVYMLPELLCVFPGSSDAMIRYASSLTALPGYDVAEE
jgi:hypothetical protein